MLTLLLTYDPLYIRMGLAALVILLAAGYLFLYVRHARKLRVRHAARRAESGSAEHHLFAHTLLPGTSVWSDLMRGLLILLALFVAASLIVVVLPQGTFDQVTQNLRLRHAPFPPQERISLLYLGDETKGNEFHVRGAIRNISTQPIEKLDVAVRLYAGDGSLIETAVVRMDAEVIAPDAISSFHLAYFDYKGQFARYSVDFKLRQGEVLPYKDMRGAHGRS